MTTPQPLISKWFVWTSQERTFAKTYKEAWRLSQQILKRTGRCAVIEPVYSI